MKKFIAALCIFVMCITSSAFALECEFAIEPQFSSGTAFVCGAALVNGNSVTDRYGKISSFDGKTITLRSNGLVMVVGENDLAAFFDKSGNQLTDYLYDTYPVTDPKTKQKTYKFGYYDGDGKSDLVPFSRGKKYGYINPYGTEVIPPKYDYAYGFYNGIARICAEGILSEYGMYVNGKYGFIKENGEEILPPDSYWVGSAEYDYGYAVGTNGITDTVLVDRYGNVARTDEIGYGRIEASYIRVRDAEGREGIADKERNLIIPMDFYWSLENFNTNFFVIDAKKIVNNRNEVVYEAAEGEKAEAHYVGITEKSQFVRISKQAGENEWNRVYGMVNCLGEVIIEAAYSTLYDMGEGLIYGEDADGNYLFDYSGKILCELNGNNAGRCVDGLFSILDFDTMKVGYMLNPLYYPKVYIDGKRLEADVYPKIENDRTMVPLRAVFESLGAFVEWDGETRTVIAAKGENMILLQIGSNILYKNGEKIIIDVPAKIENERTLVPLRAVSEALECNVEWDGENRVVNITM